MSSSENFDCVFCKETFADKEALQIHFRKHGDPNFQQNRNKSGQNEVMKTTASPKAGLELVSCDACPEVFPSISKAITHKHKVHPDLDAKYFCPWCGKLFTLKHLYNKHMQCNHDSSIESDVKDFHCDCCDVYFYVASAMLHHNKFFHRQDDLPLIGQSKKQKIYHQELLLIYYCTFCGEEYNNKVNLHKHISDDHSDENQSPDDVLRCSLCDAIFYHLDAYELHLTFHSSEDLYVETNLSADANISEYTLETVPPIMEKVEEYESHQQDPEYMGIEHFLQLNMDSNAVDTSTSKKSRKQKKHKKSKKAALTIDEFLNMNTDVFGEGLDFQGIEEVPTRVVAKQLKKKSQVSKSDIEKLKKQGIVVKKSGKPLPPQIHKGTNLKPLIKKSATQISENAIKTSSDVLSRLMNQSNNQIKIVKALPKDIAIKQEINEEISPKSTKNEITPEKSIEEKQSEEVLPKPEVKNIYEEVNNSVDENDDKNIYEEVNNSVDENDDSQQTEECSQDSNLKSISPSSSAEINKKQIEDQINKLDNDKVEEAATEKCSDDNNCAVVSSSDNINNFTDSSQLESKYENVVSSIKSLQNIGQQVTIKPLFRDVECKAEGPATTCQDKLNKDIHKENDNVIITSNQNKVDCYSKPINVLKKLGNITIKTTGTLVKQSNNAGANENLSKEDEDGRADQDEEQETDNPSEQNIQDHKITTTKSLDVLKKHLSNLITIKSVPKSSKNNSEDSDDTGDEEKDHNTTTLTSASKANIENVEIKNTIDDNQIIPQQSIAINIKKSKSSVQPEFNEENKIPSNEIVNRIKNITTKPITNTSFTTNILSQTANTTNTNVKTLAHSKAIDKDIEIFNIDSDSDDDTQNSYTSQNDINHTTIEKNMNRKLSQIHTNNFKNTSKNIMVKSIVKKEHSEMSQVYEKRMSSSDEYSMNNESFDTNDEDEQLDKRNSKTLLQKDQEVKKALKDVLKNLSKHVTVKSNVTKNPSPRTFKFQDQNSPESVNNKIDDAENCSNSSPSRVKISEIVTENDDIHENVRDNPYDNNVVISSPHDSQNEELDDIDIESTIKKNVSNTKLNQNKQLNKPSFNLNNLNNISKDITIKSLNEKETNNDSADEDGKFKVPMNKSTSLHQNLNKELTIKSCQPTISETREEKLLNKTNQHVRQMSPSTNQHKINQRQIASANQQFNTVNNEVTVKTVQTKTFVEEITTTVTRTIRTVNQTVKHEAQAVNQMTHSSDVGLQKKPQMNSAQQRLPMNTLVKQTLSTEQPRFSTSVRPTVGPTAKNQLASMRSGLQVRHRNPAPKIPVKQNIIPSITNQQRPMLRKPLRISPHVMNTAAKRPSNEDSGPFSCFKKPKESLIPVSDVPSVTDQAGSTVQYSSSQIQSNFSNITKISKSANSTVTSSTQMKSDARTSAQQQFSRLNNTSGLRVVKSAQQNIAAKVEQKRESTSGVSKRTLDAIEMLQKQGLLVKKPRVEVKNDSVREHSDSENECGDDTHFEEDE